MYEYSIGAVSPTSHSPHPLTSSSITLSSKSTSYFIPIQLALSQFPASILPAVVGWIIGYAYRYELIPGTHWRVPWWLLGQGIRKSARPADRLRQRLHAELSEGMTTGRDGESSTADGSRRRNQ
jgi:ubiquitin-associated domain-containing protein 2